MEGRLPPEPVRTRPEGLIDRLELAVRHLAIAAEALEKAEKTAEVHSLAATTQIRGARGHLRHTREAVAEAKRSLKRDTVPIAEGLKKSARRPI